MRNSTMYKLASFGARFTNSLLSDNSMEDLVRGKLNESLKFEGMSDDQVSDLSSRVALNGSDIKRHRASYGDEGLKKILNSSIGNSLKPEILNYVNSSTVEPLRNTYKLWTSGHGKNTGFVDKIRQTFGNIGTAASGVSTTVPFVLAQALYPAYENIISNKRLSRRYKPSDIKKFEDFYTATGKRMYRNIDFSKLPETIPLTEKID